MYFKSYHQTRWLGNDCIEALQRRMKHLVGFVIFSTFENSSLLCLQQAPLEILLQSTFLFFREQTIWQGSQNILERFASFASVTLACIRHLMPRFVIADAKDDFRIKMHALRHANKIFFIGIKLQTN